MRLIDEDGEDFPLSRHGIARWSALTFFICENWFVWGKNHETERERETHTLSDQVGERDERIVLFLLQSLCCPKLA